RRYSRACPFPRDVGCGQDSAIARQESIYLLFFNKMRMDSCMWKHLCAVPAASKFAWYTFARIFAPRPHECHSPSANRKAELNVEQQKRSRPEPHGCSRTDQPRNERGIGRHYPTPLYL